VEEAIQAGLTRKQLRSACWRRVGRGVYVWAELADEPTLRLRAVQRRLPPGGAFSGLTAAWLHGLDLAPCDPVEVTVAPGSGLRALAGVRVRRSDVADADLVLRRGLPATSAVRTAFDLARRLPLVDAVVAVDAALHGRIAEIQALRSLISASRKAPGITQARRVVELAEPAAESPMESRLRLLVVLAGLPRPEVQVPLYEAKGRFLGRPDLHYRLQRLALEYDGGTHRDSLIADNRRQNRLLSAGIRLLRFTAGDVYNTLEATVVQVRTALAASARWGRVPGAHAVDLLHGHPDHRSLGDVA
jgi:hypothetical protein